MPTVINENGYRLFFYSNENKEPTHIHIEKGNCISKIWVDSMEIADVLNYKAQEIKKAIQLASKHKSLIIKKWNEHFQ